MNQDSHHKSPAAKAIETNAPQLSYFRNFQGVVLHSHYISNPVFRQMFVQTLDLPANATRKLCKMHTWQNSLKTDNCSIMHLWKDRRESCQSASIPNMPQRKCSRLNHITNSVFKTYRTFLNTLQTKHQRSLYLDGHIPMGYGDRLFSGNYVGDAVASFAGKIYKNLQK